MYYNVHNLTAGLGCMVKYQQCPGFWTWQNTKGLEHIVLKLLQFLPRFIVPCTNVLWYVAGLQDFSPEPKTYDVIWCQWVLGHLTDEDFVGFMKSCKYVFEIHMNDTPETLMFWTVIMRTSSEVTACTFAFRRVSWVEAVGALASCLWMYRVSSWMQSLLLAILSNNTALCAVLNPFVNMEICTLVWTPLVAV